MFNRLLSLLLGWAILFGNVLQVQAQSASDVFISEYIEGSSNNKAIELYNGTGSPINLGAGNYVIQMFFNGSSSAGLTIPLTGTIPAHGTYIVAHGSASFLTANGGTVTANLTNSAGWYNGDDAVVLKKGGAAGTVLDAIGQVGTDPGSEWGTGLNSTADNTLRKKASLCQGDVNTTDAFAPSAAYEGFAQDEFSGLGTHTSDCGGTVTETITVNPVSLSFTNASGDNIKTYVLDGDGLTQNVTVTTSAPFSLSLDGGVITGEGVTLTADQVNAGVTVYVHFNTSTAGSYTGSVTHTSGAASATLALNGTVTAGTTPVYAIQGTTDVSPYKGTVVTTEGIVVADFQASGQLNGFYIQDVAGDGNPVTSDGIFVFNTSYAVNTGDKVRLTGTVEEYFNLTEIKNVTSLNILSTGNTLPVPAEVILPVAAISELESFEGMLVKFPQTLTATEVYTLGRYGEVSLSANGRIYNPTNFVDPNDSPASGTNSTGTSNVAAVTAQQDYNNRSRILLDDASTVQNPAVVPYLDPATNTLRVGSTVAGVTGVLSYDFSKYRIQPTAAPAFNYAPRPAVPAVGAANVKVASFNVLNYFNGDGNGGGFPTARGANTPAEFTRQRNKIIAAINQLNADVIGLIEIENDGSGANSAIADLVKGLNDATAPGTYAYIADPSGANGNPGTDAIKQTIIYKPAVVTPSGASVADMNAAHNRPPVAQTFVLNSNGEKFTAIINHFKSKSCGSAEPDQFDGQGCYNPSRKAQAAALLTFIADIQASTGDKDIITLGDYNAYSEEDPMDILQAGGLVNLLPNSYSYVFDGQSGSLDHALVSPELLASVTGAEEWHINADEPIFKDYNQEFNPAYAYSPDAYRSSDHDPVLVGLNLQPAAFKLQLIHSADGEGGYYNMSNFAAVVEKLETEYPNTIKISSGDNWLPGPFFSASGDRPGVDLALRSVYNEHFGNNASSTFRASIGRADISVFNLLKFDAATLGNHEFDAGTSVVGEIVGYELSGTDRRWAGAQFPYLSANLDFSGDASLAPLFTNEILDSKAYLLDPANLTSATPRRKIAPATIITVNGEQIGVVGATTQILEGISSTGGVKVKGSKTNNMAELATYIQPVIDQLKAMGINKIILSSHLQQLAFERELVTLLHGVDIVIAGGSHSLIADQNDVLRPGDVAVDTYPIVTQNADSEPALLLNGSELYKYVGRLVVDFDANGVLDLNSLNPDVNGVYNTTDDMVIALHGSLDNAFAPGTKAARVKTLVEAVKTVIAAKDGNIIGKTAVYLNGRRTDVRTQETNLGNISNDANIAIARKYYDSTVVVGIKNGGGIRTSIGEVVVDPSTNEYQEVPPLANPEVGKQHGDISQLDIENSLRFNNSLSLVTVTPAQLLQIVNHGVAAVAPGATPGQFPQIGGLKFSFDPSLPAGSRVKNLVVTDSSGKIIDVIAKNGAVLGNPERGIRVVTLTFLLTGGDGYPFPAIIAANPAFANRVDLVTAGAPKTGLATFTDNGSEQDAFAEYIAARYSTTPYNVADVPASQDERIQNLSLRGDSVLGTAPVVSSFSKSVNEDAVLTFSAADFTAAYSDAEGDALTGVTVVTLPTIGRLRLNNVNVTAGQVIPASQLNSLSYAGFAHANGTDSFTWKAANITGESGTASVSVTVIAVNDAPVATDFSVTTQEDVAYAFSASDFIGSYTDVEGKQLDKITIVKLPVIGKLKLNGVTVYTGQVMGRSKLSSLVFEPNPHAYGTDKFIWKASDGQVYSQNADVFISVEGGNDAPVASDFTKTTSMNATVFLQPADFYSAYSDDEGKPINKITVVTLPASGRLKLGSANIYAGQVIGGSKLAEINFVPAPGMNGTVSFIYKVSDFVNYSNEATIRIQVGSQAREEKGEMFAAETVTISPVPAADFVNVNFTSAGGTTEISLVDALANEVLHESVNGVAGSNSVRLSVGHLASGMYYVNVISGEKRSVHKIMISGK